MLIVEPSFLALTTTPSIAPSSTELTWPVSATVPCPCAAPMKRASEATVTVREIRVFICPSSPLSSSARERGLDALRCERRAPQPHAGRVEERVRHRRRDDADRRLARPRARGARRSARLPAGLFSRRLDDRRIARSGDVFQPERDGVLARGGGQLVDELLAAELDLRSDRIAQVRASERRTGVEERRDHLP